MSITVGLAKCPEEDLKPFEALRSCLLLEARSVLNSTHNSLGEVYSLAVGDNPQPADVVRGWAGAAAFHEFVRLQVPFPLVCSRCSNKIQGHTFLQRQARTVRLI
ncbi:hypothetical protein PENTCL1PPCAC_5885, partial [Pristionchus entomophagus]